MLQNITKKPIINGEHLQRIVIDSNRQIQFITYKFNSKN